MDGEWQTVIEGVCNDRCLVPLSLNKLNNQQDLQRKRWLTHKTNIKITYVKIHDRYSRRSWNYS